MLNFRGLNIENIKNLYLYFLTFYSVTLSYTAFFEIPTRYFVYSLPILMVSQIKKFVSENIIFSLIFLILAIHLYFQKASLFSFYALIAAISLFILVYENLFFFKKNLTKIFHFGFYFVIFYLILNFILNENITNQFFFIDKYNRNFFELIVNKCSVIVINNSNLIFSEASHLGSILPTLFGAFLLYEKNYKLKIILSLIYYLICILIFSNTLVISNLLLILIFFIVLKSEKKYLKEKIIILILPIILTIFISLNPAKCLQKISQLSYDIKKNEYKELTQVDTTFKENNFIGKSDVSNMDQRVDNIMNPSSFVYKFHFLLILENLKQNPLGVGFNNYKKNYEMFYNKQLNINKIFYSYVNLNYNDAASNGLKLLGEFGLIVLIPIILLIKFSISLTIDKKIKVICLVLILSQVIRGSGYFTSGFILVSFILICFSIKSKNSF